MKKLFAVLAAIFLLAIVACSGGGGSSSSSESTSKIAVGETSDGTSVVAADTNGIALVNKLDSKAIVLRESKSTDTIVIYYGDNNLPVKAIISGNIIILYSNWTTNSVDLAIILPDKTYTIKRNLQVDSSIISSIQNAQKSADFKSSIHSASDKTISADLLTLLNLSSDIVSVALCGAAIASSIADAGALVPWACTSLVLQGIAVLTKSNLDPAETAWDSITGITDAIGGCTDEISCATDLFGLGVDAINLAQTTASNNSTVINQAQNALSNSSTSLPNLTPYKDPSWSDKIIATTNTSDHVDATILTSDDNLYVDWACINNGNTDITQDYNVKLYVDGIFYSTQSGCNPLTINIYCHSTYNESLGKLSVGTHTIKMVCDADNQIVESNENDNEYTKTIMVTAPGNTAYSISGTVSGAVQAGVTITITGTVSTSTTTDSSGNYSFSSAANSNYTITPSKTGYTFSPTSISITVNNANLTGQNFTATANSAPTAALVDNGDGTVTDNGSGLMWQKATAPGTYTWQQALSYCESLSLAGHTDWRLPNYNELLSLVNSHYYPAIDPLLAPYTVWGNLDFYWTSTSDTISPPDPDYAWYVEFETGFSYIGYKYDSNYVRAVR